MCNDLKLIYSNEHNTVVFQTSRNSSEEKQNPKILLYNLFMLNLNLKTCENILKNVDMLTA